MRGAKWWKLLENITWDTYYDLITSFLFQHLTEKVISSCWWLTLVISFVLWGLWWCLIKFYVSFKQLWQLVGPHYTSLNAILKRAPSLKSITAQRENKKTGASFCLPLAKYCLSSWHVSVARTQICYCCP